MTRCRLYTAKRYVTQGVLENLRNIWVYTSEKAGNPDVDTRQQGRSELGRISCSRLPRRWSACPRRKISFFRRIRRGYCCTNARVERSLVSEGLAGQAASTGTRTGSCCCSCKSAISSFRQLLYTVSWLVCDSSTSNPARQRQVCRGGVWGVREAGWKHG